MIKVTLLTASLLLAAQAEQTEATQGSPATPVENVEGAKAEGSTPPAAPKKTAKVATKDDEIVCKRQAIVGSRFTKRVCATREQWRTLRERSRLETTNLQRGKRGFEPSEGSPGF